MRVAVVENTRITHHGLVGVALNEAGLMIDVFRPREDGRLPETPDSYAGLVVFGGEQSALDDARNPYLPHLARLMRDWGEAGGAVLGICLGAQLLARGFGAANHVGAAPEFGWNTVRRTAAGVDDPVFSAVPDTFRSFQWHSDTFALPPGAVHLAEGESVALQGFRVGARAYGMQFHFEASRAVVGKWATHLPGDVEAMAPGWLAMHDSHAARHGAAADAAGLALARAWVGLL
jgi:GMP synthase-like glutamine amidotransferase